MVDLTPVGELWSCNRAACRTSRPGVGTVCQLALLVLQPGSGFALAVLTNHSPNGLQVIEAALAAAGLKGPAPEAVQNAPVDEYAGVYEAAMGRLTITP